MTSALSDRKSTFFRTSANFFGQTSCHRLCLERGVFHSITGRPHRDSLMSHTLLFVSPPSPDRPVPLELASLAVTLDLPDRSVPPVIPPGSTLTWD